MVPQVSNVLSVLCRAIAESVAYKVSSFPQKIVYASLCSFICLQAVYQLSGPVCKSTWRYFASYSASYLHFTLYFLSI